MPVEPEPAVLEERRPSASSRGRARPRRGSPRRLAVPGGFALAIAAADYKGFIMLHTSTARDQICLVNEVLLLS